MDETTRKNSNPKSKRIAGLLSGVLGLLVCVTTLVAPSADAAITWDAPPTCFKQGVEPHQTKTETGVGYLYGLYSFAYEYHQDYSYGTGIERRYIYVYEVQNPMGGMWQMATVGRAEKLCGAEYFPTNIA